MLSLAGQAVVITGAASGLGSELALILASRGCHLYLVDRDLAGLQQLQRRLPPGPVRLFDCDLGDPAQRAQLMAAITAEVPRLGLLINCAGIGSHTRLEQLSPGEVSQVLQVNTIAPLELAAGLYPLLAASPAAGLVNIGSTAGEAAMPSMGLYCASKAAVHAFSRATEMELWSTHVRCLLVVLGSLRGTRFAQSIRNPAGGQPGWYRRLDACPAEVARAIIVAVERGDRQLVFPSWYGPVLWVEKVFSPLTRLIIKLGYRQRKAATALQFGRPRLEMPPPTPTTAVDPSAVTPNPRP
jgi:short-subunit dehydrogenase